MIPKPDPPAGPAAAQPQTIAPSPPPAKPIVENSNLRAASETTQSRQVSARVPKLIHAMYCWVHSRL
jgi:hypothetical protein